MLEIKLKADRSHLRDYSKNRQTPYTDNDSSGSNGSAVRVVTNGRTDATKSIISLLC